MAQPIPDHVSVEDFFVLEDLQKLQDAFAEASGVAAVMTDPRGRPLTRQSNPTELCVRVIHATAKGKPHCLRSLASLGRLTSHAPLIRPCLSAGLLEGVTGIFVGDRHIANWLIGQVLDESADLDALMAYAKAIEADETAFRDALARVPRMSRERFARICQALHHFATHLSALAMRNFRQEQFIDELRTAQAGLKARDRNLADIIDFLPDPTLVVDREGAVVFWNRALENLTGVPAEAMLGKKDFAYGTPFYGVPTPLLIDYARGAVHRPDARYAVAAISEDAIIGEVDLTVLPGGPRRIWAKAVALRDETGRITGAIEAIRDVTNRHRVEMALRESEEKFRRIVETANEGVWVVDIAYRTTFVNRRLAAMLGYEPGEILGRSPEDFMTEECALASGVQRDRRRQGFSDVIEQQFRRKDGTLLWVLSSASPLYDASGRPIGALDMLTDITDRKRVEKELADQRQRLETEVEERTRDLSQQAMELAEANIRLSELDRLKSVFLSTVSHELRTPLTSILGFAKLISRDFADHFLPLVRDNASLVGKGRRIGDNLQVVFSEAERLTRLINDVLDLNRIESGNMQWRDRLIDPVAIVCQTTKSLDGLLSQRPEITFNLEVEGAIPPLRMDPDQLIQVTSNLLNNAVKFTKAGEVRLTLRREGDDLLLVVRDTGKGIPAEQLDSIFDKFHQVRHGDTVDDTAKGTGLGLAICRQIVRHYGGSIRAESELGRGSAFFVRLPLARD